MRKNPVRADKPIGPDRAGVVDFAGYKFYIQKEEDFATGADMWVWDREDGAMSSEQFDIRDNQDGYYPTRGKARDNLLYILRDIEAPKIRKKIKELKAYAEEKSLDGAMSGRKPLNVSSRFFDERIARDPEYQALPYVTKGAFVTDDKVRKTIDDAWLEYKDLSREQVEEERRAREEEEREKEVEKERRREKYRESERLPAAQAEEEPISPWNGKKNDFDKWVLKAEDYAARGGRGKPWLINLKAAKKEIMRCSSRHGAGSLSEVIIALLSGPGIDLGSQMSNKRLATDMTGKESTLWSLHFGAKGERFVYRTYPKAKVIMVYSICSRTITHERSRSELGVASEIKRKRDSKGKEESDDQFRARLSEDIAFGPRPRGNPVIREGDRWNAGAGVFLIAADTGRILLQKRSPYADEGLAWGVFGGTVDPGDVTYEGAALRELYEETKYTGPINLVPAMEDYATDENFRYFTFIGLVPKEFDPTLDFESADGRWFTLEEFMNLRDKHYGLDNLWKCCSDMIVKAIESPKFWRRR